MQKRLRNFKHAILSFEHNLYNLGLHNPGRYCGFDTLVSEGIRAFSIHHTESGITYKDPANSIIGPFGMLCTPQGTLIMEDAAIGGENIEIDTNAGNAEKRFDLLIFQHSQTQISGGQDGTYSVLKGPTNNPIFPVIGDIYKQIIIGVIEIPPNATDINDCTWTKAKCPDSGDGEDARLFENNVFRGFQGFCSSQRGPYLDYTITSTDSFGGTPVTSKLWELDGDANMYQILPGYDVEIDAIKLKNVPLQDGEEIKLLINNHVILRSNFAAMPSQAVKGYRGIFFTDEDGNSYNPTGASGQVVYGIKPPSGEKWVISLLFYSGRWNLLNIEAKSYLYPKWRNNTLAIEQVGTSGTIGTSSFNWLLERNKVHLDFVFDLSVSSVVPGIMIMKLPLGSGGQPPLPAATGRIYSGSGILHKSGEYTLPAQIRVSSIIGAGNIIYWECSSAVTLGNQIVSGNIIYEI